MILCILDVQYFGRPHSTVLLTLIIHTVLYTNLHLANAIRNILGLSSADFWPDSILLEAAAAAATTY